MATYLSKNFTLEELVKSETARRKKIDNTPTNEVKECLTKLAKELLQPIREAYGKPIIVSSGYRSPKLNKVLGGATNSDHKFGCAVDFHSVSDTVEDNRELFNLVVKMANEGKIKCRQILDEYNYNWVHVSINNKYNSTRNNQVLHTK